MGNSFVFLHKSVRETVAGRGLSLADYFDSFGFFGYLHPDRRQVFAERLRVDAKSEADAAAAVVARLFANRVSDDIIEKGLRCCRDILLGRGYRETTLGDLQRGIGPAQPPETSTNLVHSVIVAGCQTEALLENRVDMAIELISNLQVDVSLVFAGGAPERDEIRIPDESTRMKVLFEQRMSERHNARVTRKGGRPGSGGRKLALEHASTTTRENIHSVFEGGFLVPGARHILYLVSSTFHLLRFATECEKAIATGRAGIGVEHIVLCGAEGTGELEGPARHGRYIKLMFYDIFLHLMERPDFLSQSEV